MNDTYNLDRFLAAQENVYAQAYQEISNGRKRSHWMWFIFPQVLGLGQTETSRFYAIRSEEEAVAYLNHPVLGPRLLEISEALLSIRDKTATEVMGYPDDLKLKSSMTLFSLVSEKHPIFQQVLDRYFGGEKDQNTIQLLNRIKDH